MRNLILAAAAAATVTVGTAGLTREAQARDVGLGIAAGILGGLVIGSAIARHHGYYGHYYADSYDRPSYRSRYVYRTYEYSYQPRVYYEHRRHYDYRHYGPTHNSRYRRDHDSR